MSLEFCTTEARNLRSGFKELGAFNVERARRYRLAELQSGCEIRLQDVVRAVISWRCCSLTNVWSANMGKVIRFVPKSERERARLIGEARAIYDSIIPPADPMGEQQDDARFSHAVESGNAHNDGVLVS
jgi:hypothetical protein